MLRGKRAFSAIVPSIPPPVRPSRLPIGFAVNAASRNNRLKNIGSSQARVSPVLFLFAFTIFQPFCAII
jgi:hypothetical protein